MDEFEESKEVIVENRRSEEDEEEDDDQLNYLTESHRDHVVQSLPGNPIEKGLKQHQHNRRRT